VPCLNSFLGGKKMKEIEKKFIVSKNYELPAEYESYDIMQKYLHIDSISEIRIRQKLYFNKQGEFTKKTQNITIKEGNGDVRKETEISISPSLFDNLWDVNSKRAIHKLRYLIPYKGKIIEVDEFPLYDNFPIFAEIEFESEKEMENFEFPDWFKKETEVKNKDIFMFINSHEADKNINDIL